MIRFVLPVFCLFCSVAGLFAQRDYAVHFVQGAAYLPNNFNALAATSLQPEVADVALRYVQFEAVLTQEEREYLESKGVQIIDYLSFATYLTAFPAGYPLQQLAPLRPRAIVPVQAVWKMHRNLTEPPYGDWAVQGNQLDIAVQTYPFISIREAAEMAQSRGATVLEQGNQNGYLLLRIEQNRLEETANWPFLKWLELKPEPGVKEDLNGRSLHRANLLDSDHPLGKKYNGSGVNTLTRDDGAIGPHIDFQGRLFNQPGVDDPLAGTHGDGVAGIIGGAGNLDPTKKGMAAGAGMYVIDYTSAFQDQTLPLFQNQNVTLTNSSYSNGCNAGYTLAAQTVDQQIFDYPTLMHVFSAGNSNNNDCGYGAGTQWGNITGGHKMAKNAIATANLTADGSLAGSSSRGPANDGRLKPDIAAHGAGQNSTDPDNTYQVFGGTSAAAPGIAGCLAQLTQAYREINNTPQAPTALLKAALLNTANDLGNIGPDFKFGWGHVNNYKALRLLENQRYTSGTITQNGTKTHSVNIPAGVRQARLMLYWADPEAAANAAKALVNDLDITVTGPGGTVYRPWKLNPTPNATLLDTPAGNGRDSLNNAEQVAISNPAAGNYTITIKGFEVPQGPQTYYVLWEYLDDQVQITYPVGGDALTPGSNVWIRWDAYGNTDPFTLRYSNNGGASFSTIASPANSDRMYNWTVPNTTSGKVKLLLIRGSSRDTTDYDFTIAPQPGSLTVTRVCPDSVTLSWTKVNNPALAYDVYVLGQKYMEIKTTTAPNAGSAKVPISNPLAENWFSIRARDNDGLLGQRINAVKWPGGLLGCSQNQDLALVTMVEPAEDYLLACDPVSRQVTVRIANNGLLAASGATISYQLGAGTIVTEPLPDIVSGAVLDFSFATPLEFNENGVQTLKINVQFTGDLLLADNELSKSYTVVVKGTDMPFVEDFEASGTLPAGWSIENPDGFTTWFLDQAVQADGSTGRVVRINHYSYSNPSNQQDYLNLVPLDLGQFSKPWLNFEYSHALYNSSYTDGLRVEIFPDCDRNATPLVVWEKFDPELAVLATTSSFTPANANEWRKDSVSLEPWAGSRVYVRFTAINGYGNNTFLNNIQLRDLAPPQAQFSTAAYFCAGVTQSFSAAASPGFNNSYTWNFGAGANISSATGIGPHQVSFQGSTQAQVQLVVKNAAGTDTATLTIPVYEAPGVTFDASTAGAEVQFTSSATQADTWTWDFGDGSSSSNPNPQHTYATEGTYTVTLTVQGPCGTASAVQTVFALNTPVAGFEAVPAQGCAPLSVSFTNTSSDNTSSFLWTIEGGSPSSSTDVSPVVVFDQPGVYTVQLLAENALGNNLFSSTIVVGGGPTAQFSSSVLGKSAFFSNGSLNASSYSWNFGDGQTSTQANPDHLYAEDGVYTVTLTTYNDCGSATFSESVTIATPPLASFSGENVAGCAPFTVTFTNLSSGNSSAFEWEFPGGIPASSTETNPVVVYPVVGAYSVTLRAINAQGVSESTQTDKVVVLGGPEAGLDTQISLDTLFCNNTSTNATSYLWSFGDGNTSTDATPVHRYSSDGVYTLMLIAFNDCGADTISSEVTIVTPPVAGFSINGGSGCAPLEVTFNNEASDNATDFLWSFPGGTPAASAEKSPTVVYEQAGVYSVTLHAGNAAGTSSIEKTDVIVVNTAPVAGFAVVTDTSTVQCINYSNGASSYFWQFGDGNTSTEFEPQHTYEANGVYVITLSATNECGSSIISDTAQVFVSTAEDVRQNAGNVRVFPNPNQGRFNVWITGTSGEEVDLYLFDPLGRQLKHQTMLVTGSELRTVLDFSSLPSGVYSLLVRQAGESRLIKLLIVNG